MDWDKYEEFEERLSGWFETHKDEFLKFERIKDPKSKRKDLNAFLILAELDPESDSDIICGASHDVIFLEADLTKMMALTEEIVIDLIRCGVMWEDDHFRMFA